jgi:hypothetical protein
MAQKFLNDIIVLGSDGSTATIQGAGQSTLNLKTTTNSKNNYIVGSTAGSLSFRPNGTEALLLNSSKNAVFAADIFGKSVDGQQSKLYKFGGLFFTWDSDSYGTSDSHSIRSTYGNTYTDSITLNSYNHIRFNIDANNNNSTSYFEVGDGVTDTSNIIFRLTNNGTLLLNATAPTQTYSASVPIKLSVQDGMSEFETTLNDKYDWQNSPISILERGNIGSGSTDNKYSPNLNFHWSAKVSNSLWMDHQGALSFGAYSSAGVPDRTGTFHAAHGLFNSSVEAGALLKFGTNGFSDIVNIGTGAMRFKPSGQTLALTLTGANATFAGNVTLSSTAPILYLTNTTSLTGKNWRFSSAANGNAYITQDGVVDAITLKHTTGNAHFGGDVILPATKALYLDGGGGTYIYESSDGVIDFYGDTVQLLTAKQNGTQSEVVVNEGSGDVDFRVEANNDTHAFFVEAEGSGKVGIGLSNPSSKLHIRTSTNFNYEFEEVSSKLRFSALNDARDANVPLEFAASSFGFLTGNATFAGNITTSNGLIQGTRGGATEPNSSNSNVYLIDSRSMTGNVGGSIVFGGYYNASDIISGGPYIKGYKENNTSDDYGFGLKFGVRKNGSGSAGGPVLTLNSSGNATFAGNVTITGDSASPHTDRALTVNRGQDGNIALQVLNSGEVVTNANYFYATGPGVSMYVQNTAVFRGSIVNDVSDAPVTIGDHLSVAGDITIGAHHIGRDADNYVGFETDNIIKFRVNGATQVKITDGVLAPQTDSDVDLGSDSTRFKNIYADTLYGDGSNLTGVTSEWDGSLTGNATITGTAKASTFLINRTTAAGVGASLGDINGAELGPGYLSLSRDDTADAKQILFEKNDVEHGYIKTTSSSLILGSDTTANTVALQLYHSSNPVSLGVDYSGGAALAFIESVHDSYDVNTHLLFKPGGTETWRIGSHGTASNSVFLIKPASNTYDFIVADAGGTPIITADSSARATTFGGSVTVNGNLIGKSDHTTELGSYASGQIKRIRMSQGGEAVFGDSTTANPIGLTEGVWNSFSDSDYMSIYSRNSFRIYGYNTSATPAMHVFVGRHTSSGGSFMHLGGGSSPNGSFGTSNTILTVKGTTSGGEGIVQIVGLGNNAADNVGCLAFHSQAEADPMASIRSVRGSADDVGSLTFNTNNGGTESTALTLANDNKATFAGDIELAANLHSTGQNLKFHAAGTHVMNIDINGKVYPNTHNAYDLGHSASLAWRNIYSSGTIAANNISVAGTLSGAGSFVPVGGGTFSGIVGMGSTGIYAGNNAQLNLPGRGLAIKNDKNGSNNNWSYIENTATGSASNINFYTGNNAAALTLAHNGDATFTGNVDITKSSTGQILSRIWNSNTGGSGTAVMRIANSGGQANGARLEFSDQNYYNATVSVDRTNGMRFMVHDDSTSMSDLLTHTALTLATNKNATFAGDARFNQRVRIGDVTGLSNRGAVRIDTRGDAPADLLYGRDTDGTATSWTGVYWGLSSRGSSESNAFKVYRGSGHDSPYNSEAVALKFDPNLKATFGGDVQIDGTLSGAGAFVPVGGGTFSGAVTVDDTFTVKNHDTTSSVATQFMNGKRTSGTVPIGELIFSNNNDSVATVAGFRDGADNKGSLVFQTQNGTSGFGTWLTIKADGNIGAGTQEPAAHLQVERASGATFALSASSAVTSGNRGDLAWYNSDVSTVANIRAAADTDNVGTKLEFFTREVGGALTNSLTINASGSVSFTQPAYFPDAKKINLGSSQDLQLYHTGSHSTIKSKEGSFYIQQEKQDGNLIFQADNGQNNATSADYFYLDGGSAVHDGTSTTEMYTVWKDKSRIAVGNGKDLQLYHDGSNSYIRSSTGWLNMPISGSGISMANSDFSKSIARFLVDGANELYYNGTKRFETTDNGINVIGGITSTVANTNVFSHGTSWGTNLTLTNLNDDVSPPILTFLKSPDSGHTTMADNDYVGFINFRADNDANQIHSWVELSAIAKDVTDGSESSQYRIGTWGDGTEYANTISALKGRVAIGTSTPDARLHVKGTGASTGLTFRTTDSSSNETFYINDGGTVGVRYYPFKIGVPSGTANVANTRLQVATTAGDFVVLNDGKTGIGIATPNSKLQVKGTVNTLLAHFGGQNNTNGHWNGISLGYAEDANAAYRKIGIAAKALGDGAARQELHFLVNSNADSNSAGIGDTKMMIDKLGHVGIGLTDPNSYYGDQLVIAAPDENGITITGTGTGQKQYLCFADGSTGDQAYTGYIAYDHNNDSMSFANNGGNGRLTINSDGSIYAPGLIESGGSLAAGDGVVGAPGFKFRSDPHTGMYRIGNDTIGMTTGGSLALTIASNGNCTAAGDVVAYSDERLKTNIKTLDGSKVYGMRGVSFTKDDKEGSGVIAQELEKIAPELVNSDSEYKAVAYGNITGYLIEAIKELKAEIDELKKQIK